MKAGDLYQALPTVKRARGYHLYDVRGRRYLDLYRDSGRALLGHTPPGYSTAVKNVISRGLWGGVRHNYLRQAERSLAALSLPFDNYLFLPQRGSILPWIREAYGAETALRESAGIEGGAADQGGYLAVWRPFLPQTAGDFFRDPLCRGAVLTLPAPGAALPAVLALREPVRRDFRRELEISPLGCAALTRGVALLRKWCDLIEPERPAWERRWDAFNRPFWERRGPYLFYKGSPESYPALFTAALEGGLLLPPDPGIPAAVPFEYTAGEAGLIQKLEV